MKKSKATLLLLAGTLLLLASFAVRTRSHVKPTIDDLTMYYWFDAGNTYLDRQNMVLDEMSLTGLDDNLMNPKTVQEKGWAPGSVWIGTDGIPVPITNVPDKKLYSHP